MPRIPPRFRCRQSRSANRRLELPPGRERSDSLGANRPIESLSRAAKSLACGLLCFDPVSESRRTSSWTLLLNTVRYCLLPCLALSCAALPESGDEATSKAATSPLACSTEAERQDLRMRCGDVFADVDRAIKDLRDKMHPSRPDADSQAVELDTKAYFQKVGPAIMAELRDSDGYMWGYRLTSSDLSPYSMSKWKNRLKEGVGHEVRSAVEHFVRCLLVVSQVSHDKVNTMATATTGLLEQDGEPYAPEEHNHEGVFRQASVAINGPGTVSNPLGMAAKKGNTFFFGGDNWHNSPTFSKPRGLLLVYFALQ